MVERTRSKKTLAVLGLDALSWSYFSKIIDSSAMPYTKHLLQKSLKAELEAYPPVTPPSWSSIMTGVNPGKHGIFGFFHYNKRTWEQRLYTALDLKHPRLHEMLSFLGYRSIIFNPIPDYPIIPVRHATIVSNLFFTPKPRSYPEDAHRKYFGSENPQNYTKKVTCDVIDDCINVLEIYIKALEKAIQEKYMLLWITLNIPDILFHRCPQILQEFKNSEIKLLSLLDRMIKMLDQNHDSMLIVSDHGFAHYRALISINDILVQHSMAKTTTTPTFKDLLDYRVNMGHIITDIPKKIRVPVKLYNFVKKSKLKYLIRPLIDIYQKITRKKIIIDTTLWIDAQASDAFMPDHYIFGIYLKEKSYYDQLINILEKYSDILDYYDSSTFYNGPYVKDGPDIIVFPKFDKKYKITGKILGNAVIKGNYYDHHPSGVLIIKSSMEKYRSTLESELHQWPNYVVSTISFCLLDLPLPKSRDVVQSAEAIVCADTAEEFNYISKWNLLLKSRKLHFVKNKVN